MARAATTITRDRDALTGEPLKRQTYRLRVSSERLDNPAYVRQGDAPETTPRPLKLHTSDVEEGGLGGHCFTRDFACYLARVKPRGVELAMMELRHWWAGAYGRRRVEARFIRRFGLEVGAQRYRIALSLGSGYRSYDELMAETHHSASWIADQLRQAERFAHEPSGYVRVVRPLARPVTR